MITDNPPAFPNDARIQLGDDYQGMSLRDYLAGQALPGLLAGVYRQRTDCNLNEVPEEAYRIADAMLEARKAKP